MISLGGDRESELLSGGGGGGVSEFSTRIPIMTL